jgi:hypothetical protein
MISANGKNDIAAFDSRRTTMVPSRIGTNAAGTIRPRGGASGNTRTSGTPLRAKHRNVAEDLVVLKRPPSPVPNERRRKADTGRRDSNSGNSILAP